MRRQAYVGHVLTRMTPMPIAAHVARVHAEIWARLATDGARIGAHDLWIAATAVAHGMAGATLNARHFERVPGLQVLAVP